MACSKSAYGRCVSDFTFDIYKSIVSTQPSKNEVVSTSSIMLVMTMLQTGARSDTERQMSKVLKFENMDKETILDGVREVLCVLKGEFSSVKLNIASKIYPNAETLVMPEFLETMKKRFGAEIECFDYKSRTEECRIEINRWIAEETSGKIKDLLAPGAITSATRMMIVNAIYFKGQWNEQFSTTVTRKADFHTSNTGKIQVDMMGKTFDKIKYTENKSLACKVLELPYRGKKLGMVMILPDDTEGLYDIERNLSFTVLNNLMGSMTETEIVVNLPKFRMEASYQLKSVLSSLGMCDLFDINTADLSGIGEKLYVTEVIHKAFVEVNEEGTEAAAATAVVMAPTCCLPTMFVADHPFFFIVWDHRTSVPLIIGRLIDPQQLAE